MLHRELHTRDEHIMILMGRYIRGNMLQNVCKTVGTHVVQHRLKRKTITSMFTKRSGPHAQWHCSYSANFKPVHLSFEAAMEPCATRTEFLGQSYSLCRHLPGHPDPVHLAQDRNFIP